MSIRTTTSVALFSGCFAVVGIGTSIYMMYVTAMMGSELTLRAQTIADNNEKVRSLKSMQATYERSKSERQELSTFALTEDEAGDFLTEIERLGESQGVSITTGALKVEKKKDTPDFLAVEFIIEGKEENVRKTIELFEFLPYPSSLATLTLDTSEKEQSKSSVKVLVTLIKYDR
jgi:hypothetical protein